MTASSTRAGTAASRDWTPAVAAVAGVIAVGLVGGLATDIGPWYRHLVKPSWQPPDWLFGPAWATIYTLVAIAGMRAWHGDASRASRRRMLALFAANAVVNVAWSVLFFRLQRPDWALLDVGVLWSSILALAIVVGRSDRVAGLLLTPYLAWVSFASFLNLTIVDLNAPFAGRCGR